MSPLDDAEWAAAPGDVGGGSDIGGGGRWDDGGNYRT